MISKFISSTTTGLAGQSQPRERWSDEFGEKVLFLLPRPQTVEAYHSNFNIVDRANKIRQNGIRLESRARSWRARVKLWGWSVVISNAFALHTWENRKTKKQLTRARFCRKLVSQILVWFKTQLGLEIDRPRKFMRLDHVLERAKNHPYYVSKGQNNPQRKCSDCRQRGVGAYCTGCSQDNAGAKGIRFFCETCFKAHI